MNTICITNRALSQRPFFQQLGIVASADPKAILLREKDQQIEEYTNTACKAITICHTFNISCLLHSLNLPPENYLFDLLSDCEEGIISADGIQMTMRDFLWMKANLPAELLSNLKRQGFRVGVSTHSVEEAVLCEKNDADYVTASHIFPTACKKNLAPRGLVYLQSVCRAVNLPVYALGGIQEDNAASCLKAGASGVCVMSLCMQQDAKRRIEALVNMPD